MSKKITVALKQLPQNRYKINRLTNTLSLTFERGRVKVGDEIDFSEAQELCEKQDINVSIASPQ